MQTRKAAKYLLDQWFGCRSWFSGLLRWKPFRAFGWTFRRVIYRLFRWVLDGFLVGFTEGIVLGSVEGNGVIKFE